MFCDLPVCHMAQHSPTLTAVAISLPVLVTIAWRAPQEIRTPDLEPLPEDNPSRAPPSLSL